MSPARAIIVATLRQLLGRRRLILFGLLAVAPAFIAYLNVQQGDGFSDLDALIGSMAFHLSLPVPLTTMILATAALGTERRDGTLSFLTVRPIRRESIAAAKIGAALIGAGALNVTGALALAVVYGSGTGDWDVAAIAIGSLVATTVYTAFFVPLGFFSKWATLIGIAFVLIWENGIVGPLGTLGVTSPWRIGYAAFASTSSLPVEARSDSFLLSNLSVSIGESLFQMVLFIAISLVLLSWTLRRRDLI